MPEGPTAQAAPAAPVEPAERVRAIDAMRGLALFGVLAINLDTEFRLTLFEQFMPPPPLPAIDRLADAFLAYFLEFKAISLFSLLFGIGLAIQHERLAARGLSALWLVRRLLVLLGFGLVHLLLIWNGDILVEYALAGLLVIPFLVAGRGWSLAAALVLFCAYAALPFLELGSPLPSWPDMQAHVVAAREAYGEGSILHVARFRIAEVPLILPLLAYVFPRTLALMLLGAWLWRSGAIAKARMNGASLALGGLGLVLAGLLVTAQVRGDIAPFVASPLALALLDAAAPVVTALGYACLVLPMRTSGWSGSLFGWAVPVGRMAFSNYIAQSIALSVLFYGFGLGMMGELGPAAGLMVALALFACQSVASARWLATHRFGPLEWLWRALTYGTRPQWTVRPQPAGSPSRGG